MPKQLISVVIPVFSEYEVLPETYRRTRAALESLDADYEIIFVDDGSRDNSFDRLREFAQSDPKTKVVRFSRNFGHQLAVTAGLDHATGDAVVVMDADLQDEPEMILKFVEKWREGYDVVYNIRGRRIGLSPIRRIGTDIYYGLLKRLTTVPMPEHVGLFRLLDRKVVDVVRQMREANRFLPGIFAWTGFRQTGIESDRPERAGGEAKSLGKLIALAFDAFVSFSNKPLRIAFWFGISVSLLSFLLAVWLVIHKIVAPASQLYGWTSTVVIILFLGGIQLTVTGIIGEYIGRLYDEVKRRPLYVVGEKLNFGPDQAGK